MTTSRMAPHCRVPKNCNGFSLCRVVYEPNSGLYLSRTRAYDPSAARWLSRDLGGEDVESYNRYDYVGCSPLRKTDRSGRMGEEIIEDAAEALLELIEDIEAEVTVL